jgi:hypothetical protein
MSPRRNLLLLAPLCLLLAACGGSPRRSASEAQRPGSAPQDHARAPQSGDLPVDLEGLKLATDPCAEQLHEICGPLLLYYVTTKKLPDSLHDLAAFADEPLQFNCPVSHEQYIYRPIKLTGTTDHPELVMYDTSAAHDGKRYGIVGAPPLGNRPVALWVVQFDEKQMQEYLRPPNSGMLKTPAAPAESTPAPAPAPSPAPSIPQ